MSPLAPYAAAGIIAMAVVGPWIIFGALILMVLYHGITDVPE